MRTRARPKDCCKVAYSSAGTENDGGLWYSLWFFGNSDGNDSDLSVLDSLFPRNSHKERCDKVALENVQAYIHFPENVSSL